MTKKYDIRLLLRSDQEYGQVVNALNRAVQEMETKKLIRMRVVERD